MIKSNECRVNVWTQYYENYSDSNVPYWKPKGGRNFTFVIDSDIIMYSEELVMKGVMEVLEFWSDGGSRFEYVSHEVVFFESEDITDKLKLMMDEVWRKKHWLPKLDEREEWWRKTHLEELYYESEG